MSFEIVTLEECLVGGLTVPLIGMGVTSGDLDLIDFTWDRYRARGDERPRVAAYVGQGENSAAVLGYGPASLDEVTPGDVVTRIPAGRYAKFSVSGPIPDDAHPDDARTADPAHTVWGDIVQAERTGQITRTYIADVERFDDPGTLEVYVSVE